MQRSLEHRPCQGRPRFSYLAKALLRDIDDVPIGVIPLFRDLINDLLVPLERDLPVLDAELVYHLVRDMLSHVRELLVTRLIVKVPRAHFGV